MSSDTSNSSIAVSRHKFDNLRGLLRLGYQEVYPAQRQEAAPPENSIEHWFNAELSVEERITGFRQNWLDWFKDDSLLCHAFLKLKLKATVARPASVEDWDTRTIPMNFQGVRDAESIRSRAFSMIDAENSDLCLEKWPDGSRGHKDPLISPGGNVVSFRKDPDGHPIEMDEYDPFWGFGDSQESEQSNDPQGSQQPPDLKDSEDSQGSDNVTCGKLWIVKSYRDGTSALELETIIALFTWLPSSQQALRFISAYILPSSSMEQLFLSGWRVTWTPMPHSVSLLSGRMTTTFSIRGWALEIPGCHNRLYPVEDEWEGLLVSRKVIRLLVNEKFRELRTLVTMTMLADPERLTMPFFAVVLGDNMDFHGDSKQAYHDDGATCQGISLLPAKDLPGLNLFLTVVIKMVQDWELSWSNLLTSIANRLAIPIEYLETPASVDQLMFDRSFDQSRKYFTLIQFLRSAARLIKETSHDFSNTQRDFERKFERLQQLQGSNWDTESWRNSRKNWEDTASWIQQVSQQLIQKVNAQMDEIISLRDSVFNATSLRETNNGMLMNRAIYAFTVITIIYTPLAFMAGFWALPFLNHSQDEKDTTAPSGFLVSFILVPLITYTLSALVALYVGSTVFNKAVKVIFHYAAIFALRLAQTACILTFLFFSCVQHWVFRSRSDMDSANVESGERESKSKMERNFDLGMNFIDKKINSHKNRMLKRPQ